MELDEVYKALLVQAKFETMREMRYIEEELQLLEFELANPEDARVAVEQFQLFSKNPTGKPKLVALTPKDVDRIVKNNRFVPLDTVELLRIEDAKNEMLKR